MKIIESKKLSLFLRRVTSHMAAIQYVGMPGYTIECIKSIARLINFGDKINTAKLLSCEGRHCFLLKTDREDYIAVRSGFSSGYRGEGPRGLSTTLQLLSRHGADINEYIVSREFLEGIDNSCLLSDDIDVLEEANPVIPERWHDYIYKYASFDYDPIHNAQMLKGVLPVTVPFALIDSRLMDLALKLEIEPDASINSGYRRLEDIVRKRSGLISESGSRLFSKAFQGEKSIFYWEDIDGGEHNGKASLFTAVFNAYRNRRAHRELDSGEDELLREFLLINELFILENKAVQRPDSAQ